MPLKREKRQILGGMGPSGHRLEKGLECRWGGPVVLMVDVSQTNGEGDKCQFKNMLKACSRGNNELAVT